MIISEIEKNKKDFEDLFNKTVIDVLPIEFPFYGYLGKDMNVYPINEDTKVLSKLLEMVVLPKIELFAKNNNYVVEPAKEQNYYPDHTLIPNKNTKIQLRCALDVKTSYLSKENKVNGLTLGTYAGYFKNRDSLKNINYAYNTYNAHYVLGIIYERNDSNGESYYSINDKGKIPSPISKIIYFLQEKYKIASRTSGSGNTKNIGSIKKLNDLKSGNGPFSNQGENAFDKHWMKYEENKKNKKE